MGSYRNAVITNQGLDYIAQALAGEITLTFSHMAISDYAYPEGTNLAALTSLQSVKMTVVPASVWVQDTTVGVRGMFSNTTVATEYPINTVGVYATNGTTEILFSVSTATSPDIMEAYNGVAPSSFIYTVQETINEASSLNITISEAGMATAQDIADLQEQKQDNITGAASSITGANLTASRAVVSDASGKVAASDTTAAEIGYVHGVTSNIQTQLNAKQATVSGAASTVTGSNLTASRAVISNGSGKIAASDTTSTELGYVHGVTSSIQTQLNGKQATINGGASTIASSNLTASRALVSNSSGKVAVSAVTATELGYLDGVTSAIQTQLNNKVTNSFTASRALGVNASGKVAVASTTTTELNYLSGVTSNVQTQLNAKQATITGAASTIATSNLTASRALISNGSGKVAVSAVTSTELGYLDGVTSNVQTQINNAKATLYDTGSLFSAVNVKSATSDSGDTTIGSFSTPAGDYLCVIAVAWGDSSVNESKYGHRVLWISDSATTTYDNAAIARTNSVAPPTTGFNTRQNFTTYLRTGSTTTWYIRARQYNTGGTTITATARYFLVKLSS